MDEVFMQISDCCYARAVDVYGDGDLITCSRCEESCDRIAFDNIKEALYFIFESLNV